MSGVWLLKVSCPCHKEWEWTKRITKGLFGPWMLASKKAKKKLPAPKLSTAIIGGSIEKKRLGVVKGVGSRFDILGNNEDMLLTDKGEKATGPNGEMESTPTQEPMLEDVGSPSTHGTEAPLKAQVSSANKKGGHNGRKSYLGPRIRDVKKAARSAGALKKVVELHAEPGFFKGNGSFFPHTATEVKGILKKGDQEALNRELQAQEKIQNVVAMELGAATTTKELVVNDDSNSFGGPPENASEHGKGKDNIGNNLKGTGNVQSGGGLLEQNSTIMS